MMHHSHENSGHGSSRSTPEPVELRPELSERPDMQKAVVDAVEVAAERGLPLAADLVGDSAADQKAADDRNVSGLPHAPPWSHLTPEVVRKVSDVDIMRALSGIVPRMKAVEAEIERLVTTPIKLIADVASHTLGAGGKRLRPALTLISAQVCGDTGDIPDARVVTCAAAVELTHTTTLLHDDVVDGASTRRGKPTANLKWGNEPSVLVGDYLFAQVFVTASQPGFSEIMQPLALATAQMCAGELLETQTRCYLDMKEKQYLEIISLKTAALTDCACRIGALAMEAPPEHVERLARFGHDIGRAFQIVDDVFDLTATEDRIGKPVGNDVREGDITMPMLRVMQTATESEKDELRALIGKYPITEEEVQRALQILRSGDAMEYSMNMAGEYIASAKSQLEIFEPSPARDMLYDIADYVLSREK